MGETDVLNDTICPAQARPSQAGPHLETEETPNISATRLKKSLPKIFTSLGLFWRSLFTQKVCLPFSIHTPFLLFFFSFFPFSLLFFFHLLHFSFLLCFFSWFFIFFLLFFFKQKIRVTAPTFPADRLKMVWRRRFKSDSSLTIHTYSTLLQLFHVIDTFYICKV